MTHRRRTCIPGGWYGCGSPIIGQRVAGNNPEAAGSNPVTSTTPCGGVAQLGERGTVPGSSAPIGALSSFLRLRVPLNGQRCLGFFLNLTFATRNHLNRAGSRKPQKYLTDAGALLREDHPHSLRATALLEEGPEHYALWKHLVDMVRDGRQNGFAPCRSPRRCLSSGLL